MGAGDNRKWQTYIKSFVVSLPDSSLDKSLPSAVSISGGKLSSGDRPSLFTDDTNNYIVRSEAIRGLGQLAGANVLFALTYTDIDTMRVTYSVSGIAGASASVFALNVTTGQYEQIDSVGLTTARQTRNTEFTPAQIAKYVSTSGGVNLVVRGVLPVRAGRMPGVFSLAVDKVNILTSKKQ
jgi:hypothetical protein